MMVMMIAMTPSVKASSRALLMVHLDVLTEPDRAQSLPLVKAASLARLAVRLGCKPAAASHDPSPKSPKGLLVPTRVPIDQIPMLALGYGVGKRRDQPAGFDVVIDVRAYSHGDADAVG